MTNICSCGCGTPIDGNSKNRGEPKRFIHGHNWRRKQRGPMPSRQRALVSQSKRGSKYPPRSQEHIKHLSEANTGKPSPMRGKKKKPHSEETITKIRVARAKQIFPIKETKIERIIAEELDKLGIEYIKYKQFGIRGSIIHQVDFFIEPNICVECDGDYWHSRLLAGRQGCGYLNIQRDYIIDYELERKGMKVIRLWESDINNNLSWCIKQIKNTRQESRSVSLYNLQSLCSSPEIRNCS